MTLPAAALPAPGQLCAQLRITVTGHDREGYGVTLERAGLSLPVMAPTALRSLADDELVQRRQVELDAAEALMEMRSAAAAGHWNVVEALLETASRRFAGNEWVAAVLEAMRSIAASRERVRAMKELRYSSNKLTNCLPAKNEQGLLDLDDSTPLPAYLRRKLEQGKA